MEGRTVLPMIIIISGIILLIAFFIISSYFRRKIYKEIDALEGRKIQILNKPLTDEIAKVKGIEMVGKTEEQFELWRTEWDEIVTIHLPNLEEHLFDAEEAADKYLFKKAKGYLADMHAHLKQIEDRIAFIKNEVNELITSEELNRKEINDLKEQYKQLRKYLLTHHIELGGTAAFFDKELEQLSEQFTAFNTASDSGDHLEARRVLLTIDKKLIDMQEKVDVVPELIVQIKSELPNTFKELELGVKEMSEQGYLLEHLGVQKEIDQIKKLHEQVKELITQEVKIAEATDVIQDIHKKVDQVYDVLEAEVLAKKFVTDEREQINQRMQASAEQLVLLKEETEEVQLSYQIEKENLDLQKGLEKSLHKLQNRLAIIEEALDDKSHSFTSIREMLEEVNLQMEELQGTSQSYQDKLQNLRKDELQAIKKVQEFRRSIAEIRRMAQKSNLPGLPEAFYNKMDEAISAIELAVEKLDARPLQMQQVSEHIEEAEKTVVSFTKQAEAIIDQAIWAERVIQYGNRYRSRYNSVAIKLATAEDKFRHFQYEEALELAADAVEEVEPGVIQVLEEKFEELERV